MENVTLKETDDGFELDFGISGVKIIKKTSKPASLEDFWREYKKKVDGEVKSTYREEAYVDVESDLGNFIKALNDRNVGLIWQIHNTCTDSNTFCVHYTGKDGRLYAVGLVGYTMIK